MRLKAHLMGDVMPGETRLLTEEEFRATFATPMHEVAKDDAPPFDFWQYFDHIPETDFQGHNCPDGQVEHAWTDHSGRFQHVLVNSDDKNISMVLVLDLRTSSIHGHRILDLNHEYGLYDETTA